MGKQCVPGLSSGGGGGGEGPGNEASVKLAVYLEDVSLSIVLALNQNDLQVEMAPVW